MDKDKKMVFSNHALKQMFQRGIAIEAVKYVIHEGTIIINYPDDKPYPCKIIFAVYNSRPLHVVCTENIEGKTVIVITTYEPSSDIWEDDFKTKKE